MSSSSKGRGAIASTRTGLTGLHVAMQMPAETVERDVYGELLNAMNAPGPSGDATFRLKTTCRTLMRRMGVRMLIIDEMPC